MNKTPICTGACIFGKCPNKTCVKYSQTGPHRAIKAEMSILTSGNLPKGPTGKTGFGIAVDIGTTTVAAYLYDFDKGECVAIESALNPQVTFGVDVISRIKYCRDKDGGEHELAASIRTCINTLSAALCEKQGIGPAQVVEMAVTGNTTMLHLFADTDPSSMGEAPFTVPDYFGYMKNASELGLNCGGQVYIARCISAFVGGDITSAILSSGMRDDPVSLLLDIGTNGEVALHAGGKLYVTSTAAGPAFEGSELSCGMAAVKGAVSVVYALSGEIKTSAIGGLEPKGICGSGVIDALALMKTAGAMDETGRILEGPHTIEVNGEPAFLITEGVHITQRDVRRIQTAKSAIAAGTLALIHRAGLTVSDISRVYLAGGFGSYMDEQNAITIGLLPEEARSIIKNIGNAAGAGAGMALVKSEYVQEHRRIAVSGWTNSDRCGIAYESWRDCSRLIWGPSPHRLPWQHQNLIAASRVADTEIAVPRRLTSAPPIRTRRSHRTRCEAPGRKRLAGPERTKPIHLYLINPRNLLVGLTDLKRSRWNRYRVWKPLGLLTVAALTPAEWQVTVFDENIRKPDYEKLPAPGPRRA